MFDSFFVQLILQILPTDFGDFLQARNHKHLRLCGPANSITTGSLYYVCDQQRNVNNLWLEMDGKSFAHAIVSLLGQIWSLSAT